MREPSIFPGGSYIYSWLGGDDMGKRRFDEPTFEDWIRPEKLKEIEELAGQGKTLAEIANKMGIGRTTLFRWREKSEDLRTALKKGDDRAVEKAEQTLYELATEGKNIAALIFYLKNKRPDKWRDKRDTEITGGSGKLSFEWDAKQDKAQEQDKDKAK